MTERASPLEGGLLYAVRSFAVIRLMFMLLALVTHETRERPTLQPDRFDAVIVLGTAYALVLLVLAVRRPQPLLAWRRLGIVDLVIVAALVVYTGGPESSLRFSYFAIPFLVAFVVRPSRVALWSLAAIGSYVAIRHGGWLPRDEQRVDAPVEEAAGVAFVVLAAVAFSAVLVRLHRSVEEHARRATALAAAIVRVEDRERRKLADELHDGAVQDIAVAAREVAAALRGDGACLEAARSSLDTALEQLRGADLQPLPARARPRGPVAALSTSLSPGRPCAAASARPSRSIRRRSASTTLTVMSVLRELAVERRQARRRRGRRRVGLQSGRLVPARRRSRRRLRLRPAVAGGRRCGRGTSDCSRSTSDYARSAAPSTS